MLKNILDHIELICPRCRRGSPEGIIQYALELKDVLKSDGDFVEEGFLACANKDCGARYPILKGVPILLKDIRSWWGFEHSKLSSITSSSDKMGEYFKDMDYDVVRSDGDRNLISTYMDLHYGEGAETPAALNNNAAPGKFWETVVKMTAPEPGVTYGRSVDLGCCVGRHTFELARLSALAVGVDTNFEALSSAVRFQQTGKVKYKRREHGQSFKEVQSDYPAAENALFILADALDPPFSAETFDFVGSLNLVDNVRLPLVLIGQMDALLKKGGDLLIGSPYDWRADVAEHSEWLENDTNDGASIVRNILEGKVVPSMALQYEVEEEYMEVPWAMRHHGRYWSLFLVHLLRARKKK